MIRNGPTHEETEVLSAAKSGHSGSRTGTGSASKSNKHAHMRQSSNVFFQPWPILVVVDGSVQGLRLVVMYSRLRLVRFEADFPF